MKRYIFGELVKLWCVKYILQLCARGKGAGNCRERRKRSASLSLNQPSLDRSSLDRPMSVMVSVRRASSGRPNSMLADNHV